MAKSMNYLHTNTINTTFKAEGLGYTLHLSGACESSDASLRIEEGRQDITRAYEIINEVLARNAIKAYGDEADELHILLY